MDCVDSAMEASVRQKGRHLTMEDRCTIKIMRWEGKSYRAIAKELNCSPSTVGNELRRGTPARSGKRGRPKAYSPKLGEATYRRHRRACHRRSKVTTDSRFLSWVIRQVNEKQWSFDACAGEAKRRELFPAEERVCTKTLYNAVWNNRLSLTALDLPEASLRRKRHSRFRDLKNKTVFGRSIEKRPVEISQLKEFGHWEIDTVVGRKKGKEPVILTLLEKRSRMYLAMKIPGKNSDSVLAAMQELQNEYKEHFSTVFKTITSDNGAEFRHLARLEEKGVEVYFAHPFSSWERSQNERHNRILRKFIPKGTSLKGTSKKSISLTH